MCKVIEPIWTRAYVEVSAHTSEMCGLCTHVVTCTVVAVANLSTRAFCACRGAADESRRGTNISVHG
eukprot:361875-Chlamydomonas_euryale.AAC.9